MLAANADLQIGAGLAPARDADLHQFTDAVAVDRDERIDLQDPLGDVGAEEPDGAVASIRALIKSNSVLVAIYGTITSRPTALPVRLPASTAASKMARDCISAISG